MVPVKAPRQRRAEQAERTRRRIVEAASRLFAADGYKATTVEAIAEAADVSVETIYKRFGTKPALLRAVFDLAVVDTPEPPSFQEELLSLPPLQAVRAEHDQAEQLRLLAAFSRATLERTAPIHRMLYDAGASDELSEFVNTNHARRRRGQRAFVDVLSSNGPLRLAPDDAAETYAALANPDLFLLLTGQHGWTADQYEHWLVDTLARLLLPEPEEKGVAPARAMNTATAGHRSIADETL